MSKPQRIQRQRTKGWRMPEGAIYVGRPTKWGNPFRVGVDKTASGTPMSASYAVEMFRFTTCPVPDRPGFVTDFELSEIDIRPLRGKDLACWCPLVDKDGSPHPCHADVLIELANS